MRSGSGDGLGRRGHLHLKAACAGTETSDFFEFLNSPFSNVVFLNSPFSNVIFLNGPIFE